MEIHKHSCISQKRWGGEPEDYLGIHSFIDSTKILCSDNRHRVLHTLWAVKEIVVPVFGEVFVNSSGRQVDVKQMCERDHLLPDYHSRFIPTLGDFVDAMEDIPVGGLIGRIEKLHEKAVRNERCSTLMLSPLAVTGRLKSLLITHNSWFINSILPRLGLGQPLLEDFDIQPSLFFNAMRFEMWMDNGMEPPQSARHLLDMEVRLGEKANV